MQKIIITFLSLLTLSFLSCTSEQEPTMETSEDIFIFGSYNGFCQGNCTHLFRLEDDQVFRDEVDFFDADNLQFSDTSEAELKEVALRLRGAFPSLLIASDQEEYGCLGCSDQSILFLQMGEGDEMRTWKLDSFVQEEWDQELKDYVQLLVRELNEIIVF